MMKPDNNIAQNRDGAIENANLYFFSWGAFFMALSIFAAFLRDVHGIGKSLKNKSFKAFAWAALMAASFVTMASGTCVRMVNSEICIFLHQRYHHCDTSISSLFDRFPPFSSYSSL
jgi:hypothetical protein